MFQIQFKFALRNLYKYKVSTAINIFGLALGLASFWLIAAYIRSEMAFDSHIKNASQIYRATTNTTAVTSPYLQKVLVKEKFPEIESATRIASVNELVKVNDLHFGKQNLYYVDSSFINIFSVEIVQGQEYSLLGLKNTVVLTDEAAKNYFPNQNPIGKTIVIMGEPMTVQAVCKKFPYNTHLQFDVLVSFSSHWWANKVNDWSGNSIYTYYQIKPNTSIANFETKANTYLQKEKDLRTSLCFQSLKEVHFSQLEREISPNSNRTYIYIFSTIAILILLIAIINYINLSIAQAPKREKEIRIKKIFGTSTPLLKLQISIESILISLIALILAFAGVSLIRKYSFFDTTFLFTPSLLTFIVLVTVLVGLLSGAYSAFVIVPQRSKASIKSLVLWRKILIGFQNVVSILLIISVLIISKQMNYIQTKNLGYDRENVLLLDDSPSEAVKQQLKTCADIQTISSISRLPTWIDWSEGVNIQNSEAFEAVTCATDENLVSALHLQLKSGRNFNPNQVEYILNETALKQLHWTENEAIGKIIQVRHSRLPYGKVVGVVADFHFKSLHCPVEPLVLYNYPKDCGFTVIRYKNGKSKNVLEHCKKVFKNYPLDFVFLDQDYQNRYISEMKTQKIVIAFALLAVLISCLGIMGLSLFETSRRTKEIGIRRVNGASFLQVIVLLNRGFLIWVAIAFIVACPISYYVMSRWLENFAYRTDLSWWIFAVSGLIALVIGLLSTSYQTLRAAKRNPIESLRYE